MGIIWIIRSRVNGRSQTTLTSFWLCFDHVECLPYKSWQFWNTYLPLLSKHSLWTTPYLNHLSPIVRERDHIISHSENFFTLLITSVLTFVLANVNKQHFYASLVSDPSAIDSDYIAPLCITLRTKTWVVAYFNPKLNTFQKLSNCFSPLCYVTF